MSPSFILFKPNLHQSVIDWWFDDSFTNAVNDSSLGSSLILRATREGVGNALIRVLKSNRKKKLLALSADLVSSTGLGSFQKLFPDRVINVGVSEQNLAGLSAGIASEGYSVVMTSFAVFNPGRNWDFIRTQIVFNNEPVVIVGSHAGLATGADGATHQSLEDVALLRSLPLTIFSPADEVAAEELLVKALSNNGPSYFRLVRKKTPLLFKPSKAGSDYLVLVKPSKVSRNNVLVLSHGATVWESLKALKLVASSNTSFPGVGLIAVQKLHPLPSGVINALKNYSRVLVVEDHNKVGGLGSAVAEAIAVNGLKARLLINAVESFGESGSPEDLYRKHGIDSRGIVKSLKSLIKK